MHVGCRSACTYSNGVEVGQLDKFAPNLEFSDDSATFSAHL